MSAPRRRRAEVTADRLRDHLERDFDQTDGSIRDDISRIIDWLERLSDRASEPES